MKESKHDKLGVRISLIISRLFMGEKLSVNELAEEFNVSIRTLRRDFNERLQYLDIEIKNGQYSLSKPLSIFRSDKDIVRFAKITSLDTILPRLDNKIISLLLSDESRSPYIIYNEPTNDIPTLFGNFSRLSQAIVKNINICFFVYEEKYTNFSPYKLIHVHRDWYLVGKHNGSVKVFLLSMIKDVMLSDTFFEVEIEYKLLCDNSSFIKSIPHFKFISDLLLKIK